MIFYFYQRNFLRNLFINWKSSAYEDYKLVKFIINELLSTRKPIYQTSFTVLALLYS
jgi:hypothetical protein